MSPISRYTENPFQGKSLPVVQSFSGIQRGVPALVLAPMEGVTDAPMRELQSRSGAFAFCVSEFLRISQDVQPARVFRDHVPELNAPGCTTPSGLPVVVQLLGGDPEKLALAAQRAAELGAPGVDLNFGCPAPTVNRHDGGATLLKYPHRIRAIVEAVRRAVPPSIPVSAKMRLGWDTHEPVLENAVRAAEGGASWVTIHGRTKMQGYAPPAHWEPIGEVRKLLGGLPVIANGDLWTVEDLKRCRDVTGCEHFMLGRSALADPAMPALAARELGIMPRPLSASAFDSDALQQCRSDKAAWMPLLREFADLHLQIEPREGYAVRRIKQWIRMGHLQFGFPWFEQLKTAETLNQLFDSLA